MTRIYTGNLIAKSDYALSDPIHASGLALHLRMQGLRGARAYGWIEEQIYACHVGDLFTLREDWLDPDALRPEQLWKKSLLHRSRALNIWREARFAGQEWHEITFEMRELFGEDVKGTMNKFLRFADHPPVRNLDEHIVPRIMFIDFAVCIHRGAIAQAAENDAA